MKTTNETCVPCSDEAPPRRAVGLRTGVRAGEVGAVSQARSGWFNGAGSGDARLVTCDGIYANDRYT